MLKRNFPSIDGLKVENDKLQTMEKKWEMMVFGEKKTVVHSLSTNFIKLVFFKNRNAFFIPGLYIWYWMENKEVFLK